MSGWDSPVVVCRLPTPKKKARKGARVGAALSELRAGIVVAVAAHPLEPALLERPEVLAHRRQVRAGLAERAARRLR